MSVERVDHGLYLLNAGDNASTVARKVYGGDVHKVRAIMEANPADWSDLERVVVPNKQGRVTTVLEGEQAQAVIRRMFPNQPESIYLQPFFTWNGGKDMRLKAGWGTCA